MLKKGWVVLLCLAALAAMAVPLLVSAADGVSDNVTPGDNIAPGDNLTAQEPAGATVVIKPECLNLRSNGKFTALVTLPAGFDINDICVDGVECEGAPAIRGMVDNTTLILKFDRQSLVDVCPGDNVTLAVKGPMSDNASFEGWDTIRVIDKGKNKAS
jgi:hypothetical protein